MESIGNINYFSNMLHNDAGFLIDEGGQIMAYMSVAVNNYCKHMSFAAYPQDKHKCEFFLSSLSYLDVSKGADLLNLTLQFQHLIYFVG